MKKLLRAIALVLVFIFIFSATVYAGTVKFVSDLQPALQKPPAQTSSFIKACLRF